MGDERSRTVRDPEPEGPVGRVVAGTGQAGGLSTGEGDAERLDAPLADVDVPLEATESDVRLPDEA